jgi:excinuclease UvrABC nuclease subunit
VGPVTARKLLRAFLTTEAVKGASGEDLARIVGKAAAGRIRTWAEARRDEAARGG